jgi:hypothetical protein
LPSVPHTAPVPVSHDPGAKQSASSVQGCSAASGLTSTLPHPTTNNTMVNRRIV